jgi:hypothetical protein
VLVLGIDAPSVGNDARHHLITNHHWEGLPQQVRDHLSCPGLNELVSIAQSTTSRDR